MPAPSTRAMRVSGTGWCWGVNHDGQLGDGTFDDSNVPIQVVKE